MTQPGPRVTISVRTSFSQTNGVDHPDFLPMPLPSPLRGVYQSCFPVFLS